MYICGDLMLVASKMEKEYKYKTIVISDLHLGSKWSKSKEATRFIRDNSCETLILCGDIIDGWAIMRGSKPKWKRSHTNFMKALLDIVDTTKIIYIRGNHDDFLDRVMPISFLNIEIIKDYVYESCGKRYYVLHGDIFDKVTSSMSWLSRLGDVGYSMLLWINKLYNNYRLRRGKQYYSFAQKIKHKVKGTVSVISDFEQRVADIAKSRDCQGVICGHIHHPEIKMMGSVEYMNSGDWVESLSALVEDYDGNWSLLMHEQDLNTEHIESHE